MCTVYVNVFSILSFNWLFVNQSLIPLKIKLGYQHEIQDWYLGSVVGVAGKYLRSVLFEYKSSNV